MVKITIYNTEATIHNMMWSSSDKEIERFLNFNLPADGALGSDPDRDFTQAQQIVNKYGAKIISHTKPKYKPGRVY